MRHARPALFTFALVAAITLTGSALGVGPNYSAADTYKTTIPDSTGGGTVTADATSSVSGAISAEVVATSDSMAGFIIQDLGSIRAGAGSSWGKAFGRVFHDTAVGPGAHTITAHFGSVTRATQVNRPDGPALYQLSTRNFAGTTANVIIYYKACASCATSVYSTYHKIVSGGSFAITVNFTSTSSTGSMRVVPALLAEAQATGPSAYSRAFVSGTVTSIDVT